MGEDCISFFATFSNSLFDWQSQRWCFAKGLYFFVKLFLNRVKRVLTFNQIQYIPIASTIFNTAVNPANNPEKMFALALIWVFYATYKTFAAAILFTL
jgi:hypothetical protein